MSNKLYVGFTKKIKLPKAGFLLIDDDAPRLTQARIFDPTKHCFNPLEGMDYKKARQLADVLYTIAPKARTRSR